MARRWLHVVTLVFVSGLFPQITRAVTPGLVLDAEFVPDAILAGGATKLTWVVRSSTGPTERPGSCSIVGLPSGNGHLGGLSGELDFTNVTAAFTAYFQCDVRITEEGEVVVEGEATVRVEAQPVPPTVTASFNPASAVRGSSSRFEWHSQYATSCSSPETGSVNATSGEFTVTAQENRSITVTCIGQAGQSSATALLRVRPRGKPQVLIFPGTGGVRLETPGFLPQKVWIDFPYLPSPLPRDWNAFLTYHMSLRPHPNPLFGPDRSVPAYGVPVQIPPNAADDDGLEGSGCLTNSIGPVCPFAYLRPMVETFRDAGADVKIANYDWRLAFSNHYTSIRETFDAAYERGFNEKIYLVGHSQGTNLLRAFLMNHPDYVQKVAGIYNIGAVHLGTPTSTQGNTALAGGLDFGLWFWPFLIQKDTGLRLGSYFPASYHMNPSRKALEIVHENTGKWMFSEYRQGDGTSTRIFPLEDNVVSAQLYMRSLAGSQRLFDRGVEIQEQLASFHHGIPTWQISNPSKRQLCGWVALTYPPCSGLFCGPRTGVSNFSCPGDGTAPFYSSLGQFSSGDPRGTLFVTGYDHHDLVKAPLARTFIQRSIFIDRGFDDPSFEADFPLLTDAQVLAHHGWTLPGSTAGKSGPRAVMPADDVFEFSTPDLDAAITLRVTNLTTQEERVYRATRAGVTLLSPIPESGEPLEVRFEDSLEPSIMATTSTLFRDGFGDDVATPADAVAGDLNALDIHVPLTPGPHQVVVTADRPLSALARIAGSHFTGTKIVHDAGIGAGESLRYLRDASTYVAGTLYRGANILPMVDDVPIGP